MSSPAIPRIRSVKVADPAALLSCWSFEIRRAQYPAVGLTYRTFTANKVDYRAWAHDDPPRADFHEGDVFYAAGEPASCATYLQVVAVVDPMVEVHTGRVGNEQRHGYLVTPEHLLGWLRGGIDTTGAISLKRGEDHSGAFAWLLSETP